GDAVRFDARLAAARERLSAQAAVVDAPLCEDSASLFFQIAPGLDRAVDVAGRIVAEARRIETAEAQARAEGHRTVQGEFAAAVQFAAAGAGVELAQLDAVAFARHVGVQTYVVLLERDAQSLDRCRRFRFDGAGKRG